MNKNFSSKRQIVRKRTGKDQKQHELKQQIKNLESFKSEIVEHIKKLEMQLRQRRVIMVRRIDDIELHALRIQLADLKAIQSLIKNQIDSLGQISCFPKVEFL